MLGGIKLSNPVADSTKSIGANASEFRDKTGDIARQLAFAGLATVWLFRLEHSDTGLLPLNLVIPAFLLVLTLALDLLEHVSGTLIWSIKPSLIMDKECYKCWWFRILFSLDHLPDGSIHFVSRPVRIFFWMKVLSLISAYVFLLMALAAKVGIVWSMGNAV